MSSDVGYWGSPSSTIDWCEDNYVVSFYIAEFWNTISNVLLILVAIFSYKKAAQQGFEKRFLMQYLAGVVVGIGSACFHGTLRFVEQQCDETPMVWAVLTWNYIVYQPDWEKYPRINKAMPYLLAVVGIGFAILHSIYRFTLIFQLFFCSCFFVALVRIIQLYSSTKSQRARDLLKAYMYTGIIAVCFWLCDYHLCSYITKLPFNPQGHAWWHIFMALNSYYGPLFMQYIRADQLQWNPTVQRNGLLLPTILVEKPFKTK